MLEGGKARLKLDKPPSKGLFFKPFEQSGILTASKCPAESASKKSDTDFFDALKPAVPEAQPVFFIASSSRLGGGFSLFQQLLQQSWAPAGTLSSSMMRCSSSLPSASRTAERSIPLDIWPIIFLGGRFRMATTVLPTSCSGS